MDPFDSDFLFVGQDVIWYPHGNKKEPTGAKVTGVGRDNVCLSVTMKNRYNLSIKDGVRHVSHPQAVQPEFIEAGTWDHTPMTKLVMQALQVKKAK